MKLDRAIDDAFDAERDLAKQMRAVGERHAVEHDLYHLTRTLAREASPATPVEGGATAYAAGVDPATLNTQPT